MMMSEPLWTDVRIQAEVQKSGRVMGERQVEPFVIASDARKLMAQIRDDYQAELTRLRAELAAAKAWEPVEKYSYTEHLNMGPDKPSKWQRVEVRGRMITIDRNDTGMHAALLPQGMGVFRRKEVATDGE